MHIADLAHRLTATLYVPLRTTSSRGVSVRLASARPTLIPAPRLLAGLFETMVQNMLGMRQCPAVRKQAG